MTDGAVEIDGVDVPVRSSWIPKTRMRLRKKPTGSERLSSHIDGAPLLTADAPCPCCGHCGEAMQLMLQLLAADDPRPAGQGLPTDTVLQAFWCASDCYLKDGLSAEHPRACVARLVEAGVPAETEAAGRDSGVCRDIEGWKQAEMTPHYFSDDLPEPADDDEAEDWSEAYLDHAGMATDETRVAGFPWLCTGSADVEGTCAECDSNWRWQSSCSSKRSRRPASTVTRGYSCAATTRTSRSCAGA